MTRRLAGLLATVLVVAGCTSADDTPLDATSVPASEPPVASSSSTAPVQVPPARMGHTMVGIGDGELLVFGGRSYQGSAEIFLDDTWIYDTETESWREVVGEGPLARSQHAMAYDPQRDEVLMFGGYVGSSYTYGDTWVFDGLEEVWRRVEPATAPTARAGSVVVFDTAADTFVMFAGAEEPPAAELPLAETWLFDPDEDAWRKVEPAVSPVLVSEGHPTLFELAMVYDSVADRSVLLVAGESTWSFVADTEEWRRIDLGESQGLGADYMTAAAFDPIRGATVAYGGAPVERTEGTWLYSALADRWSPLGGATPGPLANHTIAYENSSESVFMFGGAAAVLVLDGVAPVTSTLWRLGEQGWVRSP